MAWGVVKTGEWSVLFCFFTTLFKVTWQGLRSVYIVLALMLHFLVRQLYLGMLGSSYQTGSQRDRAATACPMHETRLCERYFNVKSLLEMGKKTKHIGGGNTTSQMPFNPTLNHFWKTIHHWSSFRGVLEPVTHVNGPLQVENAKKEAIAIFAAACRRVSENGAAWSAWHGWGSHIYMKTPTTQKNVFLVQEEMTFIHRPGAICKKMFPSQ